MDQEIFLSGYCRAVDQSRMVAVEIADNQADADCAYPACPYAPNCQIAAKIRTYEQ